MLHQSEKVETETLKREIKSVDLENGKSENRDESNLDETSVLVDYLFFPFQEQNYLFFHQLLLKKTIVLIDTLVK